MDTRGLILNTAYNDFILGSNISNYLYKNHTKEVYNELTFTNSSYYFYDDEINIWCDDDGKINTIRCASSCLYQGVELIGLPFQELLSTIHILPNNHERIYLLRQFGIRKFPKKLVISLLFCNFMVENQ